MTPPTPFSSSASSVSGGGGVDGVVAGSQPVRSGARRLNQDEFAREFATVSRSLWCIAAAILGDRSRAEDVVQDAAIAAMQKLSDFEPGTSFLAWMGRFVRYTALNEARRNRMRAAAPLENVDAPASAPPTSVAADRSVSTIGRLAFDQSEFDDRVLSALNHLDEVARACLLLRTVHDMPYRDIALVLDVPEGTAMSHVHRARIAMRQELTSAHAPRAGRTP